MVNELVAMEELVCELRLFLDLLDREYLSAGVREKKMHLSNILHRVLSDKACGSRAESVEIHTLTLIDTYRLRRRFAAVPQPVEIRG
ncbi:hypothetical protein F2P81_009480 [Scophthalmus maximus]|uniref:Uncharacterized protein n=1 Tax=Scophthalmus maximus TaxID=52904 RepID=A0A6A4SUU4_SCOMX|nr:hypothetical protein F2P81_009480 [Scophthalmus maximus]